MRLMILATLVSLTLPAASLAQAFRATNHLHVVPLNATTFEVIEANGEGGQGIWCAAADYAETRLGYYGRIYIREGRGPSRSAAGRKSIVFTTDVASLPEGPFQSLSVSTSRVGVGLPVNHAIQFCRVDDRELGDLILRRH